jgi:hypothetical protein
MVRAALGKKAYFVGKIFSVGNCCIVVFVYRRNNGESRSYNIGIVLTVDVGSIA